jgi:hypothetical protein
VGIWTEEEWIKVWVGGHMDGGKVDYSVGGGHMGGGRVDYSVGGWEYGRRKSRL